MSDPPSCVAKTSEHETSNAAAAMDLALTTIQPGGGIVMSIELAWGGIRRWYLRKFRPGYVQRMLQTRQGHKGSLPFDPVDPRDIKYYRNQDTYWWADADDPFQWRESLPFVRVGLAELLLLTSFFVLLAFLSVFIWWPLSLPALMVAALVVYFFRDPKRQIPALPGTIVSPADGRLVQMEAIEDPELGKCIQVGIFLSIFNVHANRVSLPGRVISIRYHPGKFLNALRPESARENENLDVTLEATESAADPAGEPSPVTRKYRIRQITGQFARRIVCWVRPGDVLLRGEMYGMIKLGSRTELVLPDDGNLDITAKIGDKLKAGSSVIGQYK
ncbi:phosphatidylserine decarboxylase [Novipirellula aureliae]|uniref:Phosphatidylserine decarboxylase n=1 Tax=Novipirellula aureliae TaxID=2527966 RepID=A0A5C6ECX2_9BACT|nr:phosphatidylserine decarboxylase [Novipirellula aureliae]TWU45049.1 phosphatidylserine decarboxylase [Novipirellula aureliae]